jgi:16S rRNA (adenine1518-N6/adenine1519-N6)-dimethyltransferase
VHGHLSEARARLRALGLRPRRGLSQSFLDDGQVAATIVRAARLDRDHSEVLEVGPGLGILTERLVRSARRVVAIELDAQLAQAVRDIGAANLEVLTADVLRTDVRALFRAPFVVVANLPYHITSPALRHLLDARPQRLVVMTQLEVAERITARPGQMSALAVAIQAQAAVQLIMRVPRTAFFPRPKVDSAVLLLEPLSVPMLADVPAFVRLVQAGFRQRRKQLGNSLAEGLQIDKAAAIELLDKAAIEPSRRPQELTLDDWVRLFGASG